MGYTGELSKRHREQIAARLPYDRLDIAALVYKLQAENKRLRAENHTLNTKLQSIRLKALRLETESIASM